MPAIIVCQLSQVIVHASTSPKFVRVLLLALGRVAAEAASQPVSCCVFDLSVIDAESPVCSRQCTAVAYLQAAVRTRIVIACPARGGQAEESKEVTSSAARSPPHPTHLLLLPNTTAAHHTIRIRPAVSSSMRQLYVCSLCLVCMPATEGSRL